ncbi:NAD(P)-dependent oxidoreductase, partial [Actinotignum timonense]|uniref:NAD(P)-dependent oxidoreductase n=2 Tax=Actinomycetaceae TaxID=2049 RepID=UPI00254A59C0
AKVTIWGYGHIGRHLAGMLKVFGAQVRGLATSRRTEGDIEVYDGANLAQRDEILADTDVLILILPATEATANVVDASVFAALPSRAVVVNVGRGKTVNEEDLAAALREGKIAGAGLDVTATEPLPADSPLWDLATIITPHTAGGRPVGAEELILANVRALRDGGEFINREA